MLIIAAISFAIVLYAVATLVVVSYEQNEARKAMETLIWNYRKGK